MKHWPKWRLAVGLSIWLIGIAWAGWQIRRLAAMPENGAAQLVASLWEFSTGDRQMVQLEVDSSWQLQVGDPIFRIHSQDAVEQVGEVRRVFKQTTGDGDRRTMADALLYPVLPPVTKDTRMRFYTTPKSMAWVMETMLPPQKRAAVGREVAATYAANHRQILDALRPIILAGLADAVDVVQDDLAAAIARRREALEKLGTRYQQQIVRRELLPLVREEIWPLVRQRAEPIASQIGEEMWDRASIWRFGWRYLYDASPFPDKRLTSKEWQRFVQEDGIPVLNAHTDEIIDLQRQILTDLASNEKIRQVVRKNLTQVIDDSEFRSIVWQITREVLVDNPRLHQALERRWRGQESQKAMKRAAGSVEPAVRRIGDLLFGTREEGITPEFAQVLRNQILDKDRRWLVIDVPKGQHDESPVRWGRHIVLPVEHGGTPRLNPFALQLRGATR